MEKADLIKNCPEGFTFSGTWDGLHHYQKGNERNGFYLISCTTEDIKNGNFKWMCENGYTRIIKR